MTVVAGSSDDQTFTATDPDGDAITFTNTGPTFMTRTDNAQSGTTRTGNIHLAPVTGTSGTFSASVTASSLTSNDTKLFTITVTSVNNPPTLAQPSNMTVNEGQTADQTLTATDPDADDDVITLTATLPSFATLTSSPAPGTVTGTIHIAPPSGSAGTYSASVTATANGATSTRNFTIAVTGTNRAPTLAQPSNMTVNEGATQDQTLHATDPDGNALTFAKVSGPLLLTVSTTNPTKGNAHLT